MDHGCQHRHGPSDSLTFTLQSTIGSIGMRFNRKTRENRLDATSRHKPSLLT